MDRFWQRNTLLPLKYCYKNDSANAHKWAFPSSILFCSDQDISSFASQFTLIIIVKSFWRQVKWIWIYFGGGRRKFRGCYILQQWMLRHNLPFFSLLLFSNLLLFQAFYLFPATFLQIINQTHFPEGCRHQEIPFKRHGIVINRSFVFQNLDRVQVFVSQQESDRAQLLTARRGS